MSVLGQLAAQHYLPFFDLLPSAVWAAFSCCSLGHSCLHLHCRHGLSLRTAHLKDPRKNKISDKPGHNRLLDSMDPDYVKFLRLLILSLCLYLRHNFLLHRHAGGLPLNTPHVLHDQAIIKTNKALQGSFSLAIVPRILLIRQDGEGDRRN